MKTIDERANEYIGNTADYDENVTISMSRSGFRAGAKSEHGELTKWHSVNEIPEDMKWILMKVNDDDGSIFYLPVMYYDGVFELHKSFGQMLIGWRYIIDED